MIQGILLGILWAFQTPTATVTEPNLKIWEEITSLEDFIRRSVAENKSQFTISNSNPVHGYYINRVGVVLLIPIRYRPKLEGPVKEKKLPRLGEKRSSALQKREVQKKLREWRQEVSRRELIKDANFEQVVSNLKERVPDILKNLTQLQKSESLILIIEERVPAWYVAGLSLAKDPTRKIVTLNVDNDVIASIHANKTIIPGEIVKRIRRTTTTRRLASVFP